MRGRKPKPVEQKRREGNPGKRKLEDPVLIGGRRAPAMPGYLPARAKTVWRQIVPKLNDIGMLDQVDGPALEALCIQVGIMRQATTELAKQKKLTTAGSQGQLVRHPLLDVINQSQSAVRQWCERFGIEPAARTRLGLQETQRRSLSAEMADKLGAKAQRGEHLREVK